MTLFRKLFVGFVLGVGIVGLEAPSCTAEVPPEADAQAGKALWEGPALHCRNCHGTNGEGAFGPDLAGRQLSFAQFRQALRKPWGIMPTFTEQQVSDQEIANLVYYFNSLPRVTSPGPWRVSLWAGAPAGEQLVVATVGCGQCHGSVLAGPRAGVGAVAADFEWLKKMVYEHTTAMPEYQRLLEQKPGPRLRMGNFSSTRLTESILDGIWRYMNDLGIRVPIRARLKAPVGGAEGVTYTLTVENFGLPGKGLTAEDVAVSLNLPSGATLVNASGPGYQGVRRDMQSNAEIAVWQTPRIAPKDTQSYTITLSRAVSGPDHLRGAVSWAKPLLTNGKKDMVQIAPPPAQ